MAAIRKNLKEDLKYVEAFVKNGHVGTVAGINLYTKKDADPGTIVIETGNILLRLLGAMRPASKPLLQKTVKWAGSTRQTTADSDSQRVCEAVPLNGNFDIKDIYLIIIGFYFGTQATKE